MDRTNVNPRAVRDHWHPDAFRNGRPRTGRLLRNGAVLRLAHGFGKRDRRLDNMVTLLIVRGSASLAFRRRMIAALSSPP